MSLPHVVVIGGGFGGLTAAKALASAPVRVTLLDRHNHHLFQPLLYQVATATLSPGDIASPIRWILRRARNVRVLLGDVRAIDTQTAAGPAGGRLDDRLRLPDRCDRREPHVLRPRRMGAASRPGLKTLEDALAIRRRILLAFERAERETDRRPAAASC